LSADKPKLLIHSNAPHAGTGYGTQTAAFALKLKERYNLAISAFYGLQGGVIPWNGIPVLPAADPSGYGNDTIREHLQMFGGNDPVTVLTLMDVWVLDPQVWSGLDLACWVPVDHDPAPDPVVNFFKNSGAIPIAMARFGEKMLRDAGLDPLYVPHGIDTKAYRPHDKAEARKSMGLDPDDYIVGMVAANKGNPSRKCFAEAIEAFKAFHTLNPNAKLYLHTEATGRFGGVDLPAFIHRVGLDPQAVIFTDQYRAVHFPHTAEKMGEIISCFDVLLAPSAGEGFGIPVVEAQACGVPVIVSDFSAQPELVGAGWLVECTRTYTAIGSWQVKPSVADILRALKACHRRTDREVAEGAEQARAKALEYDVDTVFNDYMLPALAEVERRLEARKPKTLKAA
jgi:glycosyltransferase involved in cell wall biosynthesis